MTATSFSENKNILLRDIADLSLGYSYRGRIDTCPDGPIRLIQMRDLTDDQLVDVDNSARSLDQGFAPLHYLKTNDVIFRARGTNNTAAFASAVTESAALVSPLIRIRVKDDSVLSRYVQWFINHPAAQAFLGSGSQGSLVRMVSIEHLGKLPIVVPPLEEQKRITELADLSVREATILRRLANLKETYCRLLISENLLGIDTRSAYGN